MDLQKITSDTPGGSESSTWYALRNRQPIGPLSLAELLALIDRRILSRFDSIRRGDSDEWVLITQFRLTESEFSAHSLIEHLGGSIPGDIAGDRPASAQPDAAPFVDRGPVPCDQDKSQENSTAEAEQNTSDAANSILLRMQSTQNAGRPALNHVRTSRRPAGGWLLLLYDVPVAVICALSRPLSLLTGSRPVRAILAILLVALCAWSFWPFIESRLPVPAGRVLAEYRSLFERIRRTPANASTLAQLGQDVERVVDRWDDPLNLQANSRHPELLELKSCLDLFSTAVHELQSGSAKVELLRKVEIHLANADNRLQRRAQRVPSASASENTIFVGRNALFWGMMICDVAVVSWFLSYVMQQWRGRRQQRDGYAGTL